jgi:hypothetical protein
MTRKQSKQSKPVKAWAQVTSEGLIWLNRIFLDRKDAEIGLCFRDERIARVLITEIPRKEKRRAR